mmetsp:Transcript_10539/g.32449  ORF Transcript_10539/g.32449 Transcript_10539/m.32449 type:complete len:118 (+) Transcript_10539:302-655(+)
MAARWLRAAAAAMALRCRAERVVRYVMVPTYDPAASPLIARWGAALAWDSGEMTADELRETAARFAVGHRLEGNVACRSAENRTRGRAEVLRRASDFPSPRNDPSLGCPRLRGTSKS